MAKNPFDDLLDTAPSAPANPFDDLLDGGQQQQGPGFGARALHAIGSVLDRLGPAELRGAAQGAQDYQPQDEGFSGRNVGGVLGSMAKGAWDGLINPDRVQSAQTQYARMGVSDAPTSRLNVMGTSGKPMDLGQDRPAGDPSTAATLGMAQDMLSPTPGASLLLKAGGKAIQVTADAAKMGATKAILSHYSPTRLAQYAQRLGTFGDEKDAIQAVAEKLKENDLLYTPGKANFNLQKTKADIGGQIGKTVQEATAKDIVVNPQKVLDQYAAFKNQILDQSGKGIETAQDFAKEVLPEIQGMIDGLKPNELGQVPINKGVSFRQGLQGMVKKWEGSKNAPLIQQVAKDLQASMNQEILNSDRILGPKLAGLNQKFSDLSNAETLINPGYKKALGNAVSGKSGGLLDKVATIVRHPIDAAADPMQTLMKLNPRKAEAIANAGNNPVGVQYPAVAPGVTPEDVGALKAPFVQNQSPDLGGLPARQPVNARRALDPQPTYVPQPNDAVPGLPARQSTLQMQRRPISPIAPDPSLSVEELGKVMAADDAKQIASTQYQSDRLKALWKGVQLAKTPQQRSALMNLIRSVHKSTGK